MSVAISLDNPHWRSASLVRPWGRLRIWQAGSGPPLLLVHGLGASGRYWQAVARAVEGDYRVIAPDLAGFGGSTKGAARYDRQAHLDDLDAVVRELAPEGRLVVAGHSLGGLLGALFAARAHARMAALAVVAAPFPTPRAVPTQRPGSRHGAILALRRGLRGTARIAVPLAAVPAGLASGYPLGVIFDFVRQDAVSRRGTMRSLLSEPAVAGEVTALHGIDGELPVLLLAARDDRIVSPAALRRWSVLFPRAEAHLLDTGGHQLLLRGGGDLLVRWLQGVGPRGVSEVTA